MEKLKKYIAQWIEGQRVSEITVTPYEVSRCIDIYLAILKRKKPSFIESKVKEVLDKCGIETVQEGIGWRVV